MANVYKHKIISNIVVVNVHICTVFRIWSHSVFGRERERKKDSESARVHTEKIARTTKHCDVIIFIWTVAYIPINFGFVQSNSDFIKCSSGASDKENYPGFYYVSTVLRLLLCSKRMCVGWMDKCEKGVSEWLRCAVACATPLQYRINECKCLSLVIMFSCVRIKYHRFGRCASEQRTLLSWRSIYSNGC